MKLSDHPMLTLDEWTEALWPTVPNAVYLISYAASAQKAGELGVKLLDAAAVFGITTVPQYNALCIRLRNPENEARVRAVAQARYDAIQDVKDVEYDDLAPELRDSVKNIDDMVAYLRDLRARGVTK